MGRDILQDLHTEEERVMHGAHTLLGICLCIFLGSEEETSRHNNGALSVLAHLVSAGDTKIYRVIEMQLSLMYDLMYTKARVIHSWYGLWIRVLSLLAIIATVILMFLFVKEGESVDTDITYLLLFGALGMEIASWFIAIVSTWTRHQQYTHGWRWNLVVSLRRLVKAELWRRWSGLIGQFNMIEYRAEPSFRDNGISWLLRLQGKLYVLPPHVQVSSNMEDSIRNEISSAVNSCGGVAERMYTLNRNMDLLNDNSDFDRKVIIWHIATHLIVNSVGEEPGLQERIKETKTLSDYMMFLLIEHPDMLPGHTRPNLHTEAMKYLQGLGRGNEISMKLLEGPTSDQQGGKAGDENSTCMKGATLAREMLAPDRLTRDTTASLLDKVFGVWVEMLCYAGSHCSRDSHARSLSTGGEFLTVVWLLAGHFADYERFKRANNNRRDIEASSHASSSSSV